MILISALWAPCHINSSPPTPPSVAYMHQWTVSALVQVVTCRLFGASHYLGQCWLNVNWTTGNKFQWKWNRNSFSFEKIDMNLSSAKMTAILFRGRWVNSVELNESYMHQWTGPSLIHVIACRLTTNPLINWTGMGTILWNLSTQLCAKFLWRKCTWNYRL